MNIQNISFYTHKPQKYSLNQEKLQTNPAASGVDFRGANKLFAYQDFNITFTGRTPENFYEQEFNRKNMPESMKAYLDYDYKERRHIPPEQMMREVFKYIELADTLDDVKQIYPDEKLFKSLHENHQKNRTTILGEIKLAKEISDVPLLKDGGDNLGIYMLKKIYLEGKTVKEINKDFYEKDMNDEYRGIITRPIDSSTTAAYGIQYPNLSFWHSFIATREEYRKFFVTLPKNSVNPAVNLDKKANNSINKSEQIKSEEPVTKTLPKTRKYKIKDYQKKQLTGDIKDAKADVLEVEKKIRKRFAKDDPEASFIVKYLSPIMAVAADRVHLSEEMKMFCENERVNGRSGDEEYMFGRFWKHNPQILNYYAQTITDTIDMFEEVYGEGGLIPINKDLEVVTPDSVNQKIVDRVPAEFLELLEYTQTIAPEREKRYEEHDRQQMLWNEHFINRYGAPTLETPVKTESLEEIQASTDIDTQKNVEEVQSEEKLTHAEIQKQFMKSLKREVEIYPDTYAAKYIDYIRKNKDIDDEYKLAFSYFIGDLEKNTSKLTDEEFYDKFSDIESDFVARNEKDSIIAKLAMIDVLAMNKCKDARLYNLNTYDLPNIEKSDAIFKPIIKANKKELNRLYLQYQSSIKPSEVNKVVEEIMHQIMTYKKHDDYFERTNSAVLQMLNDACKNPLRRKQIENVLTTSIPKYYSQMKLILNNDHLTQDEIHGRFENVMYSMNADLVVKGGTLFLQLIGKESFPKYVHEMSDEIKMHLIKQEISMTPEQREIYEITTESVMRNPELKNKEFFIKY